MVVDARVVWNISLPALPLPARPRHFWPAGVDSRELFSLAADEPQASAILDNAAAAVAQAIADTLMVVDIQEVVLGGSVGLAEGMIARVNKALQAFPALLTCP